MDISVKPVRSSHAGLTYAGLPEVTQGAYRQLHVRMAGLRYDRQHDQENFRINPS